MKIRKDFKISDKKYMEFPEVLKDILKDISPINKKEIINYKNSLNSILAEDIYIPYDLPPFDCSAMDGFVFKISNDKNKYYEVSGTIAAGDNKEYILTENNCFKIMTGARIPDGGNCVLKVENSETIKKDGKVFLKIPLHTEVNQFIRKQGSDEKRGKLIFPSGMKINSGMMGVLVQCGKKEILVHKKIKIAIIATGEELVELEETDDLAEVYNSGKIVNSSSIILESLIKQDGFSPRYYGILRDDPELIKDKLKSIALENDLIITTGGIAVGMYDFVYDVLSDIGEKVTKYIVKMRPGKHLLFSLVGNKPFFSLPGNPVTTVITYFRFIRATLFKLSSSPFKPLPIIFLKLSKDIPRDRERLELVRGKIHTTNSGESIAVPSLKRESNMITGLCNSNILIHISPGSDKVKKGSLVKCEILPYFL